MDAKVFRYQFFGGRFNGLLLDEAGAEALADGHHPYMAQARKLGRLCHREELDGQPTFHDYCGPMWDGLRWYKDGQWCYEWELSPQYRAAHEPFGVIRYESQAVYDSYAD